MASTQAHADGSVESRIKALEETVQALEHRLATLEAQMHDKSAPVQVAPDKLAWRKLKRDMSQGDVEALLGSPAKVDNYGSFTLWQYGGRVGGGEVQFDSRSQKVTGWHEPE
jgi:hypothetical protein